MKTRKLLQVGVMCFGIWFAGNVQANIMTDIETGCKFDLLSGDYESVKSGNVKWSGSCDKDGFAHGVGKRVLYRNDGSIYSVYQGNFMKGKVSGKARAEYENGKNVYEGEWKDNRRDGKGQWTYPDGGKYIGQLLEDTRSYQGTYIWPNGSKYIGEWWFNYRTGYGKLILVPNDESLSSYGNDAKKVGNVYVVEGMFERDKFAYHCKSQKDCYKNGDKHLAARAAAKCNRYYPGYVGRLKAYALLATTDRFITKYVNKDRGMVTIEGTDGGNSLGYGEIREYDCGRLKEDEERAGNR